MKKYAIVIMLLLTSLLAPGQNQQKKADSLIAALNSLPNDSQRIPLLARLSDQQNDAPVIFKYAREGIALSIKLNRPHDEEAFLFALGRGFFKTDDYPKILETCFQGLELSKKLNDTLYSIRFLEGIGAAYDEVKESRKALYYNLTGLHLLMQLRTRPMQLTMAYCQNIGDCYLYLNLLDSALIYQKRSLSIGLQIHNPNIGYSYAGLGDMEERMHHPKIALSYYYQAIFFYARSDLFRAKNLSSAFSKIAGIYKAASRTDSAFFFADTAYKIARQNHELDGSYHAAALLAALYEGANDRESLRYYKIAAAAKESLEGDAKAKQLQALTLQQQQRETDLQNAAEASQKRLRLYGVLLALVLALVIVVILWYSNKKQQAANKLLKKQQEELKASQTQLIQSEKMASLGELTAGIAHEIQNPLNFVNNFSEVNKELLTELKQELAAKNYEEVSAIADDVIGNEEKINHHGKRADFIVKGMLEHSRTNTGEKQLTDMNLLCDEFLKLSYHGLRAKDKSFNAEMITHFDPNLPKVNVSQQDMGRVMLNLFNNAFYAVNQKLKTAGTDYKPEVTVTTFTPPLASGGWGVKVRDNGVGIPAAVKEKIMQPFFTTKPTGEGTGLGLSLTYDMVVKGHGGSIQVNSVEGEGSEFIVSLALK